MSRDDLFKAIDVADEAKLRAILKKDKSLASSRSSDGVSAILFTLYLAKFDLTKIVMTYEPEMDLYDLAALNMHVELTAFLETVADIDHLSGDGFSALHLASFFGSLGTAELLIEKGANVNIHAGNMSDLRPLHSACVSGQDPIVNLLLKAGAEPDVRQTGGYTPLMMAASLGNRPVVGLLLEYGADITIKSDDDRIAVDFAKAAGCEDLRDSLS